MTPTSKSVLIDKDNDEAQFELLCNYGTIISSRCIITQNDDRDKYRYSLYEVKSPFPSFEEYNSGEEFEEGGLITNCVSYEEAQIAQQEYKSLL